MEQNARTENETQKPDAAVSASPWKSMLAGLALAYLISFGIPLLLAVIEGDNVNLFLVTFPMLHLPHFLAKISEWPWQVVLMVICIPLGIMVGNRVNHRHCRRRFFKMAAVFSFFYVLVAMILQYIASKYFMQRLDNFWERVIDPIVRIREPLLVVLAGILYFYLMVYIVSLLGRIERSRKES